MYTNNNPLTYILSTVKLDAIGQHWVASLGHYNFSLQYNPGHQNTVADFLSGIPRKNAVFYNEVDHNAVKVVVHKGEVNTVSSIEPKLIFDDQKIYMEQIVSNIAGKMSKSQWKMEQKKDTEIGPVFQLVLANKHLHYKYQKDDNVGSKVLMFRDNLRLVDGLLQE